MPDFGAEVLGAILTSHPPFDLRVPQVVPPPIVGIKVRPGKLVRRVGRGVKRGARGVARGVKTAAGAMAKLAAKPIAVSFKRLALRRARMLAWRGRRVTTPNQAEKLEGGKWALAKLRRSGPIGKLAEKILVVTRSSTLGSDVIVGITGAEIAAAAAAIVAAIQQIMRALDKPGEAPADPHDTGD